MVISFIVSSKQGFADRAFHWRSYDMEDRAHRRRDTYQIKNPGRGHRTPLWKVARATAAAPRYFEAIRINETKHADGGMASNNPSLPATHEIMSKEEFAPAFFLSIGTGKKPANDDNGVSARQQQRQQQEYTLSQLSDDRHADGGRSRRQFVRKYLEIGKGWKDFMTDTENDHGVNGWNAYCEVSRIDRARLNVPEEMGLWQVPLDDWQPPPSGDQTLARIRSCTYQYLALPEVEDQIRAMARKLVRIRHARAATERWESFATGVWYECPERDCEAPDFKDDARATARSRLRTHIERRHLGAEDIEDIERRLDECRRTESV